MNKTRDKNLMVQEKNKMDLRKLEDFYVNGTVEDLIPVLNAKKEDIKLSKAELTEKLKSKFAEKSFLHRRLMNAFPNFEVTEKWKNKYNNRNKK